MAQIGLKNLVAAPITAYTPGTEPTYGTGMKLGDLMRADLTWNRGDVKLHGDDKLVARDNSVTSGSLTVQTTYLSREGRNALFDISAFNTPTTGGTQEYALGGEPSPYVGVGYVFKDIDPDSGTTKYIAYWYWRVQFSMNENMNTKGDNTEYGTPELEGEILAAQPQASLADKFRKEADFDTEAAAIAWVNAEAGYTPST